MTSTTRVFAPLRPAAPSIGDRASRPGRPGAARSRAASAGIHLKTWTEYNNLLELGAYRTWLRDELDIDRLYPQRLYQPQRYRDIDRFGQAVKDVRRGPARRGLRGDAR